jgi:AsmA-like C-terminal region
VTPQQKRSRWRAFARGSLIALALAAIGWQVAKRAIDVDQYRPRVERALEEFTGLPVAIGSLSLSWSAAPYLSAYDVSIGEGDFHAVTARLDVFPRLWPLLRSRVEIARIELVEPAVTLPAARADLESQWRSVLSHIEAARGKSVPSGDPSAGLKFKIDELLAESALLRFGQSGQHTIVTSISATGIGGDAIQLALEADVPSTGAHAEGRLRIPAQPGGDLAGDLTIHGIQPQAFAELPELAHSDWQAHAELSGKRGEELAVNVDGSFEPIAEHAFAGTFTGHAQIAPDGKVGAELEVGGEGLALSATAQLFSGDRSRVRVKKFTAEGDALAALLAAIVRDPVRVGAAPGAALDLHDFQVSIAEAPQIESGVLEAHGLAVDFRGAPIARDLKLGVRAAEGVFQIAELRGGPIDLRGAITLGDPTHRPALELTGTLALDDALVHALGAPELIRAVRGALALERLRVELPGIAPAGMPLVVRGQISGGSMQLENETIAETISEIELALTGDSQSMQFEGRGIGAAIGPISARAAIDAAAGDASGEFSIAGSSADFLRDADARKRVGPILQAYSGAPFAFEVQSEAGPPSLRRIRVERASAPKVTAALVLRSDPAEDPVRDLDVAADLPAEFVVDLLPWEEEQRVTGAGSLRIRRSEGGAGFFAEAELADLGLAVGPYLEKKPGEALRLRVEGEVVEARWIVRQLTVAGEQASSSLPITEKGISARGVDINLAAFAFLLADGGRATGHVSLDLETATKSVAVQLTDVQVWVTPELGVDSATGEIAVADHDWGLHGLRVKGGGSDATLDLAVKDSQLTGALRGERVDAAFVRAILEEEHALNPPDHEPGGPPISGQLVIALDHVKYRRAEGQRFAANVTFDRDDIHVRDLEFRVGEGRVSGRVDVDLRKPEPPLLDLDLDFTGLSRQFVDGFLDEESRGKPGLYTGKLVFTAPLHPLLRDMMPDASGSLVGRGENGTLIGRLGLATKIITVLRSTEALRMRLPAFEDEGLVFDTITADFAMDQGRVEVRKFDLDSISYAMSASGELNFREDTSNVPIEVNAIRGVTALIERVPVAGDALKIVNVRVVATGSPWDMQVRVASITDQLAGAGLAGPKAVIKGVRDVLDLMRSARGGRAPEPDAETPPPTEPPNDAPAEPAPTVAPAPQNPPDPAPSR